MTEQQRTCTHTFRWIGNNLAGCVFCGLLRTARARSARIPREERLANEEEIKKEDAVSEFGISPYNLQVWVKAGYLIRTRRGYLDKKVLLAFLQEIGYHLDDSGNAQWNMGKHGRGYGRPTGPIKNRHYII
jgi:hypothetical protein